MRVGRGNKIKTTFESCTRARPSEFRSVRNYSMFAGVECSLPILFSMGSRASKLSVWYAFECVPTPTKCANVFRVANRAWHVLNAAHKNADRTRLHAPRMSVFMRTTPKRPPNGTGSGVECRFCRLKEFQKKFHCLNILLLRRA